MDKRKWWKAYHLNACEGKPYPVPMTRVEIWPNLCGIDFMVQCAKCGFEGWHEYGLVGTYDLLKEIVEAKIKELIAGAPWANNRHAGDIYGLTSTLGKSTDLASIKRVGK